MRGETGEMAAPSSKASITAISDGLLYNNYTMAPNSSWIPRESYGSTSSPEQAPLLWGDHHQSSVKVKEEPMDDARHDSGVSNPSCSPDSDRSTHSPSLDDLKKKMSGGSPTHNYSRSDVEDLDYLTPKTNSQGKIKTHRCKQCSHVSYTVVDKWLHNKSHMNPDKILQCPQCPFATEFKHHLEYHFLNHNGTKPYKCDYCEYTCVNKSMLNSHLKSHSKVYQYRCADCTYETKYCHSLKLHLRKYSHSPAMVLNPDGTPNPLPVIDVYGTRRGPKVKKPSSSHNSPKSPHASNEQPASPTLPSVNPALMSQIMGNPVLPFPLPYLPPYSLLPTPEMLQLASAMQKGLENIARSQQQDSKEGEPNVEPPPPPPQQLPHFQDKDDVLDLSKARSERDSDDEDMSYALSNVEVRMSEAAQNEESQDSVDCQEEEDSYPCQYCKISFEDKTMFNIHMVYHGKNNPFTCSVCNKECHDKVKFFLHMVQNAH